jgi:hypothetical protein
MDNNLEKEQLPQEITVKNVPPAQISPRKNNVLRGLIIALALFFMFNLGIGVGREMERFTCNWTASYHKNFGGPQNGFLDAWKNQPPDIINSRGIFGKIIQINGDSLVVQSQDNKEIVVVVTSDTVVTKLRDQVGKETLKVNDILVVLGSPNTDGQITAKLIRILP